MSVKRYEFLATREQRVYFEVDADTEYEAWEKAQEVFNKIDFDKEDQSDDPGDLIISGESSGS